MASDYDQLRLHAQQVYTTVTCGQVDSPYATAEYVLQVWAECELAKVEDILDLVLARIENGETPQDIRKDYDL